MSIINPVTAGTELSRSFSARQSTSALPPGPEQISADPFASDRLTLSRQASVQQQSDAHISASNNNSELPSEAVQVSSSTGESRSRGNLSRQQAISLYQAVSSLL